MPAGHVLVTGGGRGIGAAVCRLAAFEGHAVTINYRADAAAAAAVRDGIAGAGGRAAAIAADVAREAEVAALWDAAEAAHGSVTGLVINAGIVAPAATVAEMTAERMARVFATNVLGAFLTAREAARRMPRGRGGAGGAIVAVSSVAARLGSPFEFVDYAASKGAVDSLVIGLARELAGQGVRVNAVRPGLIETAIHASAGDPDRAHRLGATTPLGRAGRADEVAEAVLWLLSERASYVTGAILDVAGGR